MKKQLEPMKLFQAGPVSGIFMVTCVDRKGKANIITLCMYMPISISPPYLCIGVSLKRFSHNLIAESGEFVVNVPSMDLEKQVLFCGNNSGKDLDKFVQTGLTAIPARKVNASLIKECFGHLECKVVHTYQGGDHTIFIGEVVSGSVDDVVLTGNNVDPLKAKPIVQKGSIFYTLTTYH